MHKNKSLRVKMATRGVCEENKKNRILSTIVWVLSKWRLELALQAITTNEGNHLIFSRFLGVGAAIHENCVRYATKIF